MMVVGSIGAASVLFGLAFSSFPVVFELSGAIEGAFAMAVKGNLMVVAGGGMLDSRTPAPLPVDRRDACPTL
jgi:hypothetical protein